jgi:hypothetical protein
MTTLYENIVLETKEKILKSILSYFTPELKRQYEESILFKSFVEAMSEVICDAKLEIDEAIKELNIQKASTLFLQLWSDVTGIYRKSVNGVVETDDEYKKRILDSIFWDKISNLAIQKSILLKYGFDVSILNRSQAISARELFVNPPDFSSTIGSAKYLSNIVELSLDNRGLSDEEIKVVYDEVSSLLSAGNIIGYVVKDVIVSFIDVNAIFGRIAYGPIFMQTVEGYGSKETDVNWFVDESIYLDNELTMNENNNIYFGFNSNPSDIVKITYLDYLS